MTSQTLSASYQVLHHLPSVRIPPVPHEQATEEGECIDGEIRGQGRLLSFFPNDTDTDIGGLRK